MKVTIKTTNLTLTPDVVDYVEKRAAAFEKVIDPADTTALCEVEVGKTTRHHQTGDVYRAEFNIRLAGELCRAESANESLFAAIDEAQEEMVRELRRRKRKVQALMRRGGAALKMLIRGVDVGGERVWRFAKKLRRRF